MSNIADKQRRWLQDQLKQRGRGSRRELARHLGLRDDAITRMLNTDPGKEAREIKHSEVIKMAEFFMSEPPGLAAARTAIGGPRIKVVGHVGAGAEVFPFDDYAQGDGLEELEPLPTDAVAVMVKGDSMYPRYFEGERIIYVQDGGSPADYIGQECIVKLEDGRMLLKIMRKGSRKGLFTLESWNAAPIEDQKIEWAAPVLWRGRK